MSNAESNPASGKPGGVLVKMLDFIEWAGNKLPDPAVLFLIGLLVTWGLSAWLSGMEFSEVKPGETEPVQIVNMLTLDNFSNFLTHMVEEFYKFPPLGIVLVALLGVGVAEHSGFINACLKSLLNVTPQVLLTPMLILVAIISHTAADAGYVLVIPIGGVMFYAAGRHPLAGIACAFAGVSGGFSANFIVSGLDPLLSSLTQTGVDLVDKDYIVNPLCNILFTAASCIFIIGVGWFLTDKIIEPRLKGTEIDGDPAEIPKFDELSSREKLGMWVALMSILASFAVLAAWARPLDSELRDQYGSLTAYVNSASDFGVTFSEDDHKLVASVAEPAKSAGIQEGDKLVKVIQLEKYRRQLIGVTFPTQSSPVLVAPVYESETEEFTFEDPLAFGIFTRDRTKIKPARMVVLRDGAEKTIGITPLKKSGIPGAPLMKMIVPLIFLIFVVPGLVHGYVSGNFKSHRDAIKGMSKAMETMGYYLVLVFFAALFIAAFKNSGIGTLLAIKGANFIRESGAPAWVTVLGIIFLAASVNLLIGSASAKWAMLAPIFVPMLMYAGLSPELTQAAYRVGDSTTNIITPMMPYFPLVVVFCQRYVKNSGIGTVAAMMLPYSIGFLITWALLLLIYWGIGLPLGIPLDVGYEYIFEA